MKIIKGETCKFPFKSINFIGNLDIYINDPLQSIFSNSEKDIIIFEWIDCDDLFERWLVYKSNIDDLKKFLNKEISYFNFIFSNEDFYIIDIPSENNLIDLIIDNAILVKKENIPNLYKPHKETFFSEKENINLEKIKNFFQI
jgi:hypothetical protein